MALLGDVDEALVDEAAGGSARGFHLLLPGVAAYEAGGFGRADGLIGSSLCEEAKDCGFERLVEGTGAMGAAANAAEPDGIPSALELFAPLDGAAAGGADLRGRLPGPWFGFVSTVTHFRVGCAMG